MIHLYKTFQLYNKINDINLNNHINNNHNKHLVKIKEIDYELINNNIILCEINKIHKYFITLNNVNDIDMFYDFKYNNLWTLKYNYEFLYFYLDIKDLLLYSNLNIHIHYDKNLIFNFYEYDDINYNKLNLLQKEDLKKILFIENNFNNLKIKYLLETKIENIFYDYIDNIYYDKNDKYLNIKSNGYILCENVNFGKTYIISALLQYTFNINDINLIIVPDYLINHWKKIINEYNINFICITSKKTFLKNNINKSYLILTTFKFINKFYFYFLCYKFKRIIIDCSEKLFIKKYNFINYLDKTFLILITNDNDYKKYFDKFLNITFNNYPYNHISNNIHLNDNNYLYELLLIKHNYSNIKKSMNINNIDVQYLNNENYYSSYVKNNSYYPSIYYKYKIFNINKNLSLNHNNFIINSINNINNECIICYDEINIFLECGHFICIKCVFNINKCPLCKLNINYNKIRYIKQNIYNDIDNYGFRIKWTINFILNNDKTIIISYYNKIINILKNILKNKISKSINSNNLLLHIKDMYNYNGLNLIDYKNIIIMEPENIDFVINYLIYKINNYNINIFILKN
jgi:hypothetical protein